MVIGVCNVAGRNTVRPVIFAYSSRTWSSGALLNFRVTSPISPSWFVRMMADTTGFVPSGEVPEPVVAVASGGFCPGPEPGGPPILRRPPGPGTEGSARLVASIRDGRFVNDCCIARRIVSTLLVGLMGRLVAAGGGLVAGETAGTTGTVGAGAGLSAAGLLSPAGAGLTGGGVSCAPTPTTRNVIGTRTVVFRSFLNRFMGGSRFLHRGGGRCGCTRLGWGWLLKAGNKDHAALQLGSRVVRVQGQSLDTDFEVARSHGD